MSWISFPEKTVYEVLDDYYQRSNNREGLTPDRLRDMWTSLDYHIRDELHAMVPRRNDPRREVLVATMNVIEGGHNTVEQEIEKYTKGVTLTEDLGSVIESAYGNGNFTPEGMDRWKNPPQCRGRSPGRTLPFRRPN